MNKYYNLKGGSSELQHGWSCPGPINSCGGPAEVQGEHEAGLCHKQQKANRGELPRSLSSSSEFTCSSPQSWERVVELGWSWLKAQTTACQMNRFSQVLEGISTAPGH